jgi:hypothetical protein
MPEARVMTFQERGERQKRIAEAYASGIPSERVAQMFGVSGHWVRSIARLYGVSRGYHAPKPRRRASQTSSSRETRV